MSKLVGPFGFKGRIGQISFFIQKGVTRARLAAGGLTRERIENDPTLQRVREHLAEFRGQAFMAKSFRTALTSVKDLRDGTLNARLMQLFADVKNASDADRGTRPVELSKVKSYLADLELNATQSLSGVMTALLQSTPSATRNSSVLQGEIDVQRAIIAPPGMTHFQLVHLLGVVSDTVLDAEGKKYVAASPEVNGKSKVTTSDFIALNSAEPVSVSLETTLPLETIPENATVIEGVGIRFFQLAKSGKQVEFKQNKAMRIINLF